ncbi:hypothetical protein CSPAE12_07405 [Colletotrichum incanum]|nr:hypothetical protein CSPAE12_07405 [Colletotrichum incanum]
MLSPIYARLFDRDFVPAYISHDEEQREAYAENQEYTPQDDPLRPIDVFSHINLIPSAPPTPPPRPRPGPFGPRPDVPTPPPSP